MPHPGADTESCVNKKDHLQIFATTGHETLKAFLLVSAGSVAALLAFLGSILAKENGYEMLGAEAFGNFQTALQWFGASVGACMLSFAFSFVSHAAYYKAKDCLGDGLSFVAAVMGLACIGFLMAGGHWACKGIGTSAAGRPAAAAPASAAAPDAAATEKAP